MKVKATIYICILSTLLAVPTKAADHDISIGVAGGISSFQIKNYLGSPKMSPGVVPMLNYRMFFTPSLALCTGAEFSAYRSEYSIPSLQDKYLTLSDANTTVSSIDYQNINTMLYRYEYENIEETQKAIYINIPLTLHYEGKNPWAFYCEGGFKIGIPIKSTYTYKAGSLSTSGYFQHEDITYENMPQHGFFSKKNTKQSGKLDLGINAMITLELGMRWNLSAYNALYIGAFADYGLLSLNKRAKSHLLEYDIENAASPKQNSLIESYIQDNNKTNNLAERFNTLSAGIKLQISFRLHK